MRRNKSNKGTVVLVGDIPLSVALRKFKQKIERSGKLEDVKDRMFYEKPTTFRKRKKSAAKARWEKKLKETQLLPKTY